MCYKNDSVNWKLIKVITVLIVIRSGASVPLHRVDWREDNAAYLAFIITASGGLISHGSNVRLNPVFNQRRRAGSLVQHIKAVAACARPGKSRQLLSRSFSVASRCARFVPRIGA